MIPAVKAVLFLDPGKMTGWARLSKSTSFESGELPFYETGILVREHCIVSDDALVCWEMFNVTPASYRMLGSHDAIQAIGMIRWLATNGGARILPQASRQAKDTISSDMLRALGWYAPGKGHANDAARHLTAWLIRSGSLPGEIRVKISEYLEGKQDNDLGK